MFASREPAAERDSPTSPPHVSDSTPTSRFPVDTLVIGALLAIAAPVDSEMLSGAPKSLRFRLEYWKATAASLRRS